MAQKTIKECLASVKSIFEFICNKKNKIGRDVVVFDHETLRVFVASVRGEAIQECLDLSLKNTGGITKLLRTEYVGNGRVK